MVGAGDACQHQHKTGDGSAQVSPHTNTLFHEKQ
jgi:hypothetical protein